MEIGNGKSIVEIGKWCKQGSWQVSNLKVEWD
jgi:hypothetical protein